MAALRSEATLTMSNTSEMPLYDPGYFTGGNIHPLLKAKRPNKYGYVLISSGLGFLFVA